MRRRREFFECPHCGADVMVGRKVCRECGSDAETGWQSEEEVQYQSLELPTGYGPVDDPAPGGRRVWIVVTALVAAFALAWVTLRLA